MALVFFVSSVASTLHAADLRNVLTDYGQTSWSRKDGLAGPVWAIAQDANGFLWLATDDGLVRFDGVKFVPWQRLGGAPLPARPIRALLAGSDGSLWVGFAGEGGLAQVHLDGRVDLIPTAAGGVTGSVVGIVERAIAPVGGGVDRRILVGTSDGLFEQAPSGWKQFGAADGIPRGAATAVFAGPGGALAVALSEGVFAPATDPSRFDRLELSAGGLRSLSLATDSNGRVWTSDPLIGFRRVGTPQTAPIGGLAGRGFRVLFDRRGHLWVGTIGQGLWRVRLATGSAPVIERTTVLSGLSSDAVRSVFEDRDGNIWAGTTEGVDRLVPHRITPLTGLGLVSSLDADAHGDVWIGTDEELIPFRRGPEEWARAEPSLAIRGVRIVRADRRTGVWVLTGDSVLNVVNGKATKVTLPADLAAASMESLTADPAAGVWAVSAKGQVWRTTGAQFVPAGRIDGISEDARITATAIDRQGRLWFAASPGTVGVWSPGTASRLYTQAHGLLPGPHYAFLEDRRNTIWVVGANGASAFDGQRFISAPSGTALPPGGIFAITEDDHGQLWLGTATGVLRVSPSLLAATDGRSPVAHLVFDTADGLAGFPALLGDHSGVRAADGTLWFVTSRGASLLDPLALGTERPSPRVALEHIDGDGQPLGNGRFQAGTATVTIDYASPDLTSPLKVRFRHQLDGHDTTWVDAESRRRAVYTNLPPRAYTFRAAVRGDDGAWTEMEAPVRFSIAPRFYQTWWFYPLLTALATGGIAAAWRLRLRQLRRQFSLVLGERVRVSRELHDTLLQSLVGLALEFDVVSRLLETSPATARERVVKIRQRVEEYIRDARQSIWSLRSPVLATGDLVEALRDSVSRAVDGQSVDVHFSVTGTPRRLGAQSEHQALRIAQEAALNAARHAAASHVDVRLSYSDDGLQLVVADNGRGFDPTQSAAGTSDHYGIVTMKERAEQAGGQVVVSSTPGAGTTVTAFLPANADDPEERSSRRSHEEPVS